jgi:hypothetical protein
MVKGNMTYFTSYGNWVDLSAPGYMVETIWWNRSMENIVYCLVEGTSYSAPISATMFAILWDAAEIVGKECAEELIKELESDSIFDRHLADQIMPFSAVARGKTIYTTTEVTKHQISNAYVINKFFDNVRIDGKVIEIEGADL